MAREVDGLHWSGGGFAGLSHSLHQLAEAVDRSFCDAAMKFAAEPQQFGPLIAVNDLRKIDYFTSFPHLVAFPCTTHREPENLSSFARANSATTLGPLHLKRVEEVTCVLTPAACYPVYIAMEGTSIAHTPRSVTVNSTCFRAESSFEPLVRQPAFRMREIVHIGNRQSVESFLRDARACLSALGERWGLTTSLQAANDPFFDPSRSPKYLHATLFPSKHELISGVVAIASLNNHRNFFGEAFAIGFDGSPAHTACVAFGIERWVNAILCTHGVGRETWPLLTAAVPA